MRAILVRHAPPLVSGICAGRFDVAVEAAVPSAEVVVRSLEQAGLQVARLWSSPTARCSDLAREVALRLDIRLELDARLMELDFGSWEGRLWDEVVESDRARFDRWARDFRSEAPPGGERVADLEARVAEWLAELEAQNPASRNLVVTHAGVIRAVRVLTGRCAWSQAMDQPVPYLEPLALD